MRIFLIEDEEELRELLIFNLNSQGYDVDAFSNANDALILLDGQRADMILLDLMLPGLQGLQFLEILRKKGDKTPIIIVSARNAESDIITALDKGADDYVTKPFSFKFLDAKIQAVIRRLTPLQDNGIINTGGISMDTTAHKVLVNSAPVQLTNKEFSLLHLFLTNPGRVYTRNQLLNSVWGYEAELTSRTVDSHVASLRKKLGDEGSHVVTLPKIGYIWEK